MEDLIAIAIRLVNMIFDHSNTFLTSISELKLLEPDKAGIAVTEYWV
jgi:hypothetical protein